jgi:acyl-CoA thioester hydrolase
MSDRTTAPAVDGAASPADAPATLFRHAIMPRWRDLDAFGHVNNSNFLTYLEESRIQWFRTLGREWVTEAIAPLLAAVHINYRAPIEYPSAIAVELFASRIGNTSITLGHRIVSADGAMLHADGDVVMVWIDRASGKPVPLPEAVREVAAGR